MAGEWCDVALGDVADLVRGVSYRPSDLVADGAEGIPLLRATNIRSRRLELTDVLYVPSGLVRDHQLLRRYDVVIAMSSGSRDAVGRLAQLRQDWFGCVGAFCGVIRANAEQVHPDYIGYVLQSPEFRARIEAHAVGTAIMNLSRERILGFMLQLPGLPEQRTIAHILGTLDDKIELNRRRAETLEAMARALFKSWFVDFDPVRAKAAGRDPGLPKPLADLFPARLVDSELGEIPEGWLTSTVGELANLEKGLSYKGVGLTDDGGLPMVNLGCFLGNGKFENKNVKRYQGDFRDRHLIRSGDLLIANTDMTQHRIILGSPAIIPALSGEKRYLFTHHTYAVRFRAGCEKWKLYVYFSLLQPDFREVSEGYATGTTVLALPRDSVLNYSIAFPPENLRVEFDAQVSCLIAATEAAERESDTLTALRDTLLPKLISGELRVKNAERFLKERGL